ncbi:MAG: hypothetical protein AAF941_01805 [Pseudomonadota bacterium]
MVTRGGSSWQLILADLSLILFLVTVAALADMAQKKELGASDDTQRSNNASISPAQALYRREPSGPSIGEWLDMQTVDPRATLSVIATHRASEADAAWEKAQALAVQARARGIAVRVVVVPAPENDLYASLAYDTPR